MMMIGSSVDYVRSGGMRNVPVTKAVEHLYATTAKFSGNLGLTSCVLLPATSAISLQFRNFAPIDNFFQTRRSELMASQPFIRNPSLFYIFFLTLS
ncbi:hypothetical protein AVEN_14167-1 [Araneus ventricosus]|uniref:Uncharacterized protein n=1 Tax=Araneus ventricosus TaxID=182803 RepID=A0A4Y2PBT6_ARAVE|nr:hypothetical protein AVEN_14167-1 [Araneus ventricosus]